MRSWRRGVAGPFSIEWRTGWSRFWRTMAFGEFCWWLLGPIWHLTCVVVFFSSRLGICCGQFGLPFITFFGATFIGKALIKVNLQAVFFIVLFTEAHLSSLISFFEFGSSWDICISLKGEKCDKLIASLLEAAKKQIARGHQVHDTDSRRLRERVSTSKLYGAGSCLLS